MSDDIQLELLGTHEVPGVDVARLFEAARLRQARVLKAWTKSKLAKEVGVSPAVIGQYEARVTRPSPDVVVRLADKLEVPVDFFAAGRPLAELDAGDAHFRSLRSTRVIDRSRAAAFVEQIWEVAHALEKRVRFPDVDLPDIPEGASPAAAAKALRAHWGIEHGPVRHLVATMESRGVLVTILSLANSEVGTVDAFSTDWLGVRPIVVVTPERSSTIFRYRFTCAHELGHLLLHCDVAPGDVRHEREADRFPEKIEEEVEEDEHTKQAARAAVQEIDMEVGETVRVTEGPFADFEGTIAEINLDQAKLRLLMNVFGRETPLELKFDKVAKVT